MTLAKKDYDAQAAEEAFTRLRASFQGGHPAPKDDAMAGMVSVIVYAAVAQANALDEIAKEMKAIADHLLVCSTKADSSKHPAKGH